MRLPRRSSPRPTEMTRHADQGDTLIEVLVALVIIGTASVALLGGLLTTTTSSISHRKMATLDSVVASLAEAARSTIELQGPGGYVPCSPGNPVTYQVVGAPTPGSGPVGSAVDVFGTGFTVTAGGTISGATFGGSAMTATAGTHSSSSGAVSDFTVPTEPAGTYVITPFDASHQASSTFTVTPSVGAMAPATPGSTGVGTNVTVPVTGFGASTSLTVTIGASSATIVSGSPTSAAGTATVVFKIPSPLSGSQTSQTVTISDGTNTSVPVTLSIPTDTAIANPVQSGSSYSTDSLTTTVSYWNPSSGSNWTTNTSYCAGANFNPNIEQIAFELVDTHPNNGADSSSSIVVANFNAQAVPAPPVGLAATSYQNAQIPLVWNAPGYSGTSAITGFNVYRSTVAGSIGSKITTTAASTTSYTDTGLTNGTTYYYEVTAANASGESAPSTPQQSAVPATVPGAPSGVSATPGNTQTTLTWSAPGSNGGAAITGYNIYRSTSSTGPFTSKLVTVGASASSYTDTGLTNGTPYYYEISASNPAGEGAKSTPAVSATPEPPPGAPALVSAVPGNASVQLTWTAPTPNGGPAVSSYNIYRSTALATQGSIIGTTLAGTVTYTDGTVVNGTTYYYEVTAVNSIGEGGVSNQLSATPVAAPTVPSAPTLQTPVVSHSGNTYTATLTWNQPANGGSPITGYKVYRSTTSASAGFTNIATVSGATNTTYADSPVTHNTQYWYYVVAINGVGPSANSNTVTDTP